MDKVSSQQGDSAMTSIVEIHDLVKRFAPTPEKPEGTLAVAGISMKVEEGEIFSFLGPNGAGKTTTISMMSGLLAPTSGDVSIGGFSITKQPLEVKRLIGVVPQEIALYPELSARRNIEFFGRLYGLEGKELSARSDEVLDFVGLRDRQKERIDTFSGGMKRRVNIAVGLMHRPKLVFMDEPTVGVDPQSRRNILDAVKLLNEQGMTVLYTTHYMEEAEELSNRVAIIDHGKVIGIGKQIELLQQIGEKDRLLIKLNPETIAQAAEVAQKVKGVDKVNIEEGKLEILSSAGRRTLPLIITELDDAGYPPLSIEIVEPNLETVFLHLTGRALRD